MAQDRNDDRAKDLPHGGAPRSTKEWAKAASRSPDDFPEVEAAMAARAEDRGEDSAMAQAAAKELEAYRREKQEERRRTAQPAQAERDPDWQRRDHLDPERSSRRPSRSGAAKDAEGQAERGTIDQMITDKGYTETR